MITLQKLDTVMYETQRQGRISFYMQNQGETAAQLGSAHALDINDLVFGKTFFFTKFNEREKYMLKIKEPKTYSLAFFTLC